MTARTQFYPVHLLATGEVFDVPAKDCRDALARVGRVDAVLVVPWPDDHKPIAIMHLEDGISVITPGQNVAAVLHLAAERLAACWEGDS